MVLLAAIPEAHSDARMLLIVMYLFGLLGIFYGMLRTARGAKRRHLARRVRGFVLLVIISLVAWGGTLLASYGFREEAFGWGLLGDGWVSVIHAALMLVIAFAGRWRGARASSMDG